MPESSAASAADVPIRMLFDRVLLRHEEADGERQTGSGLLIPATASLGKRLVWATVVATGQNVRQVKLGDRALYDPSEIAEVELDGRSYVLLRERDLHAVGAPAESGQTGLYL